jgi:hypothetical protein
LALLRAQVADHNAAGLHAGKFGDGDNVDATIEISSTAGHEVAMGQSPELAGGAGFTFEDAVAGSYLSALLQQG